MKSNMLCAFLIATLLVSAATFGEIIPSGTGTSSGVYCCASKGNESPDPKYEERWWCETTTEAGEFYWKIFVRSYAWCSCYEEGDWVLAIAESSGAAASPFEVVSVDAYMCIDSYATDWDGPWNDEAEGTDDFDAYESVSGMCDSFAYAAIEEGSDGSADAYATSTANPSLEE